MKTRKKRKITTEEIELVYNFLTEVHFRCNHGKKFKLQELMKEMGITNNYIGTILLKNEIVINLGTRMNLRYAWDSITPNKTMALECIKEAKALARSQRKKLTEKRDLELSLKLNQEPSIRVPDFDARNREVKENLKNLIFEFGSEKDQFFPNVAKTENDKKTFPQSNLSEIDKIISGDLKKRKQKPKQHYIIKLFWGLIKLRIFKK